MQVNITFRGIDPIDSLKTYAREKVERVNKYLDRAGDAHVVLSLERHLQNADITIHSGPFVLRGREKSEDMYASLDLAMDKIERQLRRYKERLKHHHGKDRVHHREGALAALKVRHDVYEVAEPEKHPEPPSPRIIRTNEFLTRPLKVEEAVMQMDLMNNDFYVFMNAESHEMNVVYRRKDGHYGLIEASAIKETETAGN
ncbi:MAG: ribosome hibernation-promoting factor, HPF/YfiA family [Myxococcaceae bacterium]